MILDLHIHTTAYSPCSEMSPDELMIAAKKIGLDGVCVTEHDRLWTPEEAVALSEEHGLPVFRGMEVTTTGGDILVFGLEEEPKEIWTPGELKEKVDQAGGVAIAAHPFRGFLVFGFGTLQMDLSHAVETPVLGGVHGVEVCNGNVTDDENDLARRVADEMGLLKVGGSDAHVRGKVGKCVTRFEADIENEEQLIKAIFSGNYSVETLK